MSSPLSMLKKTRRTPLLGSLKEQRSKQAPFKRNLLQEIQAELVPDPNTPLSSHTSSTSKYQASKKQGSPPSNFELMSAMMRRVTLLEETVKNQAQEMERKERHIAVLEKELIAMESGSTHSSSSTDDVERRCQQLQTQVHQMERFLGDYGLIWVGDDIGLSAELEQTRGSDEDLRQAGTPGGSRGFQVNFDLVLRRIKELNLLAGEGETFVQATTRGAKLARKDPVQLRLYGNGMVMFDGPFRSYQERSSQQCLQDIMDGYFPSELHHRFPDGVPFQVHDRRHEKFIHRLPWETFPGEGRRVCEERDEPTDPLSFQLPGQRRTTDQLLNKTPVKAGQVTDIRNSLRTALQGSWDSQNSSSEILIDTPALQATTARGQTSDKPPPESTVTLKVRSENGDRTYRVKMWLSETLEDLRSYLDRHRGADGPGYDIISAHPRHSFRSEDRTLRASGLSANSTLLLRERKHTSQ